MPPVIVEQGGAMVQAVSGQRCNKPVASQSRHPMAGATIAEEVEAAKAIINDPDTPELSKQVCRAWLMQRDMAEAENTKSA